MSTNTLANLLSPGSPTDDSIIIPVGPTLSYARYGEEIERVAGLLAGAKAILPKSCKILGGFSCAAGLTEKTPPTAIFLFFGIRYANMAVDGFVLHDLDMRPKAEFLPAPSGLSKQYLMLASFMADLKAGRNFQLPRY